MSNEEFNAAAESEGTATFKENQRVGFTKTGFSKAGFASCSRYNICLYGKRKCYYEDIDPEVKRHCFCYQRNNSKDDGVVQNRIVVEQQEVVTEVTQLSLF